MDKFGYLGRVVREIVETERTYVRDLRSIVEVRLWGAEVGRNSPLLRGWGWPLASSDPALGHNPTSTHGRRKVLLDMLLPGSASLRAPARDAAGRSHRLDLGVPSVVGPAELCGWLGCRHPSWGVGTPVLSQEGATMKKLALGPSLHSAQIPLVS